MSPAIVEAPPADPSAAITSTRLGCTRDHQPLEDELLVIGSTFEAAEGMRLFKALMQQLAKMTLFDRDLATVLGGSCLSIATTIISSTPERR